MSGEAAKTNATQWTTIPADEGALATIMETFGLTDTTAPETPAAQPQQPASAPVTCQDDLDAVQMSRTDYNRLSIEDMALILRLHGEGRTQRQIAAVIECSQQTVCYALQRVKASQSDIQQLMKADALPQLTNWKKAADKAADRGDHRPAREFIEAAYPELRPQTAASAAGGGVTIVIGMPGQPVQLPSITIESTPIDTLSLVPRNELAAPDKG